MSLARILYGGNGTTQVDSGLPRVGVIYGVRENGDLLWYRYNGNGESDRSGSKGWGSNSGNPIGNGWQNFGHILGCGDGVILGVAQNGDLLWYKYDGNGESDRSGSRGWHPNSGNPIGNGWQGFRHVFVTPREGPIASSRLTIYAVTQDGDLLWYRYNGNGESDRSGSKGWDSNSGNPIGNGWQNFGHILGCGGVILGVAQNGDLLWYSYQGDGESDRSGSKGWDSNSGNPIGNGWQNFRAIFGGANDSGGFGRVIYAVAQDGDLLWYRYDGHGESDASGTLGWRPNSGNPIGNGW
jgi:Tachylectin